MRRFLQRWLGIDEINAELDRVYHRLDDQEGDIHDLSTWNVVEDLRTDLDNLKRRVDDL